MRVRCAIRLESASPHLLRIVTDLTPAEVVQVCAAIRQRNIKAPSPSTVYHKPFVRTAGELVEEDVLFMESTQGEKFNTRLASWLDVAWTKAQLLSEFPSGLTSAATKPAIIQELMRSHRDVVRMRGAKSILTEDSEEQARFISSHTPIEDYLYMANGQQRTSEALTEDSAIRWLSVTTGYYNDHKWDGPEGIPVLEVRKNCCGVLLDFQQDEATLTQAIAALPQHAELEYNIYDVERGVRMLKKPEYLRYGTTMRDLKQFQRRESVQTTFISGLRDKATTPAIAGMVVISNKMLYMGRTLAIDEFEALISHLKLESIDEEHGTFITARIVQQEVSDEVPTAVWQLLVERGQAFFVTVLNEQAIAVPPKPTTPVLPPVIPPDADLETVMDMTGGT